MECRGIRDCIDINLLEEVLEGKAGTAIREEISRAENSLYTTLGCRNRTHETTQRGMSGVDMRPAIVFLFSIIKNSFLVFWGVQKTHTCFFEH
jgi:hypothetical protein